VPILMYHSISDNLFGMSHPIPHQYSPGFLRHTCIGFERLDIAQWGLQKRGGLRDGADLFQGSGPYFRRRLSAISIPTRWMCSDNVAFARRSSLVTDRIGQTATRFGKARITSRGENKGSRAGRHPVWFAYVTHRIYGLQIRNS